jgi:hypothetical protein
MPQGGGGVVGGIPGAHKDTHVALGTDAFLTTDFLDAIVARLRESGGPTDLLLGSISDGEFLKRDGTDVIGAIPAGTSSSDYAAAYDTTTQSIAAANVFQALLFSTNKDLDGWTHTGGAAPFTCPSTGLYEATVAIQFQDVDDNGSFDMNLRALFNSVEVPGSQASVTVNEEDTPKQLTRTFFFDGVATQDLAIQIASTNTDVDVTPGPNPASATATVSAYIVIRRVN